MTCRIGNVYMKRFLYFNLYVIKGHNGDILIDTGFIGIRRSLKRWLDKFNIKLIILTHAHVDHIWNVNYLKKLYNCDVMMGKLDIDNLDNSKINPKASKKIYKLWTKLMNFGMNKFVPDMFRVDLGLVDKLVIKRYGIDMKIVSLPGHTDGSIGILYNNYLFAGDALVNRGKYPEIAYQNQDNELAKKSYNKIIKLKPKLIFVGHDKKIYYDKLNKNMYGGN